MRSSREMASGIVLIIMHLLYSAPRTCYSPARCLLERVSRPPR